MNVALNSQEFRSNVSINQLATQPQVDYTHTGISRKPFKCGVQHCELYVQCNFPNISEMASRIRIKPATVERIYTPWAKRRCIISPKTTIATNSFSWSIRTKYRVVSATAGILNSLPTRIRHRKLHAFRIFWRFFFASLSQIFGKSYHCKVIFQWAH